MHALTLCNAALYTQFRTPPLESYRTVSKYTMSLVGRTSFMFRVRACSDVLVVLSEMSLVTSLNATELWIGANQNSETM